MLFTGIDILTYKIEASDVYKDFYKDKGRFDFSEYPEYSKFYGKANKKVISTIKDETKCFSSAELVGLKCKMCLFIKKMIKEAKRQKELMTHKEYKSLRFEKKKNQKGNKRKGIK